MFDLSVSVFRGHIPNSFWVVWEGPFGEHSNSKIIPTITQDLYRRCIATRRESVSTCDGVVFNGEHLYVDHIYYMIHVRPFGLSVPRPCLYMLGSSSLIQESYTCKTVLHPLYVDVELITPDHHVVSRHDELSQRCILRENTYTLKF